MLSAGAVSFGKTYLSIRELARHARIPNQQVYYVAPSYRQAKQIVWSELKEKLYAVRWVKKVNESELTVTLVNGSTISLRGAENYDSLRGVGLNFLVMDEFTMINKKAWLEVLRPTLSDTGGSALFISTPAGKGNWGFDLYNQPMLDPVNWASWQYTSLEGGRIPIEEIEAAQMDLDERTFKQEYLASFETYSGAIYYNFDRQLNNSTITDYNTSVIHVGMDFNIDPMSATIAIRDGNDLHIIDEIQIFGSNTDEMCDELNRRYSDSKIIVYPDPAGNQRKSSAHGRTDHIILQNAGFIVKSPRGHTPVRDRINAVNSRLCTANNTRHLFIAQKCKHTIKGLERQTYKEGTQVPDKASGFDHQNDATGYLVDYLFPVKKKRDIVAPQRWGHSLG